MLSLFTATDVNKVPNHVVQLFTEEQVKAEFNKHKEKIVRLMSKPPASDALLTLYNLVPKNGMLAETNSKSVSLPEDKPNVCRLLVAIFLLKTGKHIAVYSIAKEVEYLLYNLSGEMTLVGNDYMIKLKMATLVNGIPRCAGTYVDLSSDYDKQLVLNKLEHGYADYQSNLPSGIVHFPAVYTVDKVVDLQGDAEALFELNVHTSELQLPACDFTTVFTINRNRLQLVERSVKSFEDMLAYALKPLSKISFVEAREPYSVFFVDAVVKGLQLENFASLPIICFEVVTFKQVIHVYTGNEARERFYEKYTSTLT